MTEKEKEREKRKRRKVKKAAKGAAIQAAMYLFDNLQLFINRPETQQRPQGNTYNREKIPVVAFGSGMFGKDIEQK